MPNMMTIELKEVTADKGEPSSTFLRQPSSLKVCRVITPKATISNISCSEFHLSRATLKGTDCDGNIFRLEDSSNGELYLDLAMG